jgi:hypothetical protein
MINIERQTQCWRNFKLLRTGHTNQGGVTHVLVPESTTGHQTFRKVQLKHELDKVLLAQNITHFSQAEGTPFTMSPLIDILGVDGYTNEALDILDGNVPSNVTKYLSGGKDTSGSL